MTDAAPKPLAALLTTPFRFAWQAGKAGFRELYQDQRGGFNALHGLACVAGALIGGPVLLGAAITYGLLPPLVSGAVSAGALIGAVVGGGALLPLVPPAVCAAVGLCAGVLTAPFKFLRAMAEPEYIVATINKMTPEKRALALAKIGKAFPPASEQLVRALENMPAESQLSTLQKIGDAFNLTKDGFSVIKTAPEKKPETRGCCGVNY